MNFNVPQKKLEMEIAEKRLEKASAATAAAFETLKAIPTTGVASWGRSEELKQATKNHKASQKAQAECQIAYEVAADEYQVARHLQSIADESRAEGVTETAKKMLGAMDNVAPGMREAALKAGKSATTRKRNATARVQHLTNVIRAADTTIRDAQLLGYVESPEA